MKKPFSYSALDTAHVCDAKIWENAPGLPLCGRALKKNVLHRQRDAHRCYRHGRGRAARRGRGSTHGR